MEPDGERNASHDESESGDGGQKHNPQWRQHPFPAPADVSAEFQSTEDEGQEHAFHRFSWYLTCGFAGFVMKRDHKYIIVLPGMGSFAGPGNGAGPFQPPGATA